MHSKGKSTRHVNHPILQDGHLLILEIIQRRWKCTNPTCGNMETDEFSFVEKRRRNTNISDFLIVDAFRNPEASAAQIAKNFNVSGSHAIIDKYKNCPYPMYHKLAQILEENFEAIINSFVMLEKHSGDKVRLSNGPIESLNRITKDMKRIGRGYRNFEFIRNRFLFSTRKNATILGAPKKLEETYLKYYTLHVDEEPVYDEDFEDDFEAIFDDNDN